MSIRPTLLLINSLSHPIHLPMQLVGQCKKKTRRVVLPTELTDIIKEYVFRTIQEIDEYDYRYDLLWRIPRKEYDPRDDIIYVYLNINDEKEYFITYCNFEIQIQTFVYTGSLAYAIDGNRVSL